jgi:hypothetical protein
MSTIRTIVPKCRYFWETGIEFKPETFPFIIQQEKEFSKGWCGTCPGNGTWENRSAGVYEY